MEDTDKIKMRCAELEQKLALNDPTFRNILKEIHENIRKQPELIYVLKDEEIAVIVSGLSKHTGIEIAAVKVKEKISKKAAANLTADDV